MFKNTERNADAYGTECNSENFKKQILKKCLADDRLLWNKCPKTPGNMHSNSSDVRIEMISLKILKNPLVKQ